MNDKKVCFISCVNDQRLYAECLYYLNHLEVPAGYEVEFLFVENARSMTKGYNEAMKKSDAKYKVYLHQDIYITNKAFIEDITRCFKADNGIGMIGVVGAEHMPTNGVWWEAEKSYGKVYDSHTGKMGLLEFSEVDNGYQAVQAIDGIVMATQYDLPWREDIFDGWHFYDISQSFEFIKAGYKVAVPAQLEPWCIHDCGIANIQNGYEHYRKAFLQEYSKMIFPLVSILIPAYNQTKYLKVALESAIDQTYPNIEIIIGDDSTNNEVEQFIKPYLEKYKQVTYYKNQRDKMDYGISNVENLLKKSKGEYIAYLFHDDFFHKEKIEKMMNYFLKGKDITLVTSYRKLIDTDGKILNDADFNKKLFESDSRINGIEMCRYIVSNIINPIGEFSTAMFRRSDVEGNIIDYYGREIRCNGDIALWLRLLEKGDLIYIAEGLNFFRQHDSQNSRNEEIQLSGAIDWLNIIEESIRREKLIYNETEYKVNLINGYYRNFYILNLLDKVKNEKMKAEFIHRFTDFLHTLL